MVNYRKIPAFDLTKVSAKFEVATFNCLGGDALQESTLHVVHF